MQKNNSTIGSRMVSHCTTEYGSVRLNENWSDGKSCFPYDMAVADR